MGGLESLTIGIKHADEFRYVGGFSSAVLCEETAARMTSRTPTRPI